MDLSLQNVREASVDRRMQNVLYRQVQLERLQSVLVSNAKSIQTGMMKDGGYTAVEAQIEYVLSLHSLKEYYQALDPIESLKDEYAIARGKDAQNLEGVGIIYIVPATYSMFYSVVVAVSAALAAGNCVVVEVRDEFGSRA